MAKTGVQSDRRPVEHLPEPGNRLARVIPRRVAIGVVLRLERRIARVETCQHGARGERQTVVVDSLELAGCAEVQVAERRPNQLVAINCVVVEPLLELEQESVEDALCLGQRLELAKRHGNVIRHRIVAPSSVN